MATRERVAWIFHEKGQRLHAEVNDGKAGPPDLGCLLAGASFIRGGGPARNRVVFINTGRGRREKGAPPESCYAADLALCLQDVRGRQVRGSGGALREPSKGLSLMKTCRFLASLPSFSATEVRGNSACAGERTCRAEQRRAGRNARSTRRSRPRVRGRPCKRRG